MTKEEYDREIVNWSVQDAIRERVKYEDELFWSMEPLREIPPMTLLTSLKQNPFKWIRLIKFVMP